MNRGVRRVGLVVAVLFVAVVGQLSYLQIFAAKRLENDPRNVRALVRDYARARGDIVTSDGKVVATSVPSNDEFERQRKYPLGDLVSQVVGYQSFVYGNVGVEAQYNDVLTGRDARLSLRNLGGIFRSDEERTGTVVLALSAAVQEVARAALGDQHGSVVAIDPSTGAIVAMWSNPSFDPNPLAGHDSAAVQAAFAALTSDPANPALARAYRERYAPGSTFKLVTSGVALDANVTAPDRTYPVLSELKLPQTNRTLANFGGEACGGTLVESFVVSCNTTFGQIGLDLGDAFVPGMARFGVGTGPPPLDLRPGAVASVGPPAGSFKENQPLFALAGIGQGDVAVTPLEMALVGSAVANGGVIMQPHVLGYIQDHDGNLVDQYRPQVWQTAMSPQTAATIRDMMVQVVARGSGTGARIPGVTVAGKTGTAQVPGAPPNAWFVAFAPAEAPKYVVSVIVERGGNLGNEATGGAVAAPIAAAVLKALLGIPR